MSTIKVFAKFESAVPSPPRTQASAQNIASPSSPSSSPRTSPNSSAKRQSRMLSFKVNEERRSVSLLRGGRVHQAEFNEIFDEHAKLKTIFKKSCTQIIDRCLKDSASGLIIACGGSRSKKCSSVFGGFPEAVDEQNQKGSNNNLDECIALQALRYIYSRLPVNRRENMLIQGSFFEVEKDHVRDLGKFSEKQKEKKDELFVELQDNEVILQNLTEITLNSVEQLEQILRVGLENRRPDEVTEPYDIERTKMGPFARTTTVFQLKIYPQKNQENRKPPGVLSIVDLAATEARTTEFGKRVQGFEEDAALTQIELARFLSALSSNRDVPSVANNTITSKFLKQCMISKSYATLLAMIPKDTTLAQGAATTLDFVARTSMSEVQFSAEQQEVNKSKQDAAKLQEKVQYLSKELNLLQNKYQRTLAILGGAGRPQVLLPGSTDVYGPPLESALFASQPQAKAHETEEKEAPDATLIKRVKTLEQQLDMVRDSASKYQFKLKKSEETVKMMRAGNRQEHTRAAEKETKYKAEIQRLTEILASKSAALKYIQDASAEQRKKDALNATKINLLALKEQQMRFQRVEPQVSARSTKSVSKQSNELTQRNVISHKEQWNEIATLYESVSKLTQIVNMMHSETEEITRIEILEIPLLNLKSISKDEARRNQLQKSFQQISAYLEALKPLKAKQKDKESATQASTPSDEPAPFHAALRAREAKLKRQENKLIELEKQLMETLSTNRAAQRIQELEDERDFYKHKLRVETKQKIAVHSALKAQIRMQSSHKDLVRPAPLKEYVRRTPRKDPVPIRPRSAVSRPQSQSRFRPQSAPFHRFTAMPTTPDTATRGRTQIQTPVTQTQFSHSNNRHFASPSPFLASASFRSTTSRF